MPTRLFFVFVFVVVVARVLQVLYVVRSPHPPSGFLETVVYSDRGGLQCPEPLLPVSRAASAAHTATAGGHGLGAMVIGFGELLIVGVAV